MGKFDDFMLDNVLNKIKEITNIEKIDDTKILTGTDDKFPDDITLKNAAIYYIPYITFLSANIFRRIV